MQIRNWTFLILDNRKLLYNNKYMSKLITSNVLWVMGNEKTHHLSLITDHQKGFSLVEILVTISLVAMIAAVSVPNLQKYNSDLGLEHTVSDINQALKVAQSHAQSSIICDNGGVALSWNVEFKPTSYSFHGNCSGEYKDVRINARAFNTDDSTTMVGNSCTDSNFTVEFSKTDVNATCANGEKVSNTLAVTLKNNKDANLLADINISKGGLIYPGYRKQDPEATPMPTLNPTPTPTPTPTPSPSPTPTPPPSSANMGTFSTASQAQLPGPRSQFAALTFKIGTVTYAYVIGGDNGTASQTTVYKSTIDSISGNIGSFSTTGQGQLPAKRQTLSANAITFGASTYLYVVGGNDDAGDISTIYRATINSTTGNIGTFSTTNQAQLPRKLEDHNTVVYTVGSSTYMYLLGGNSGSTDLSTVYRGSINTTNGNLGAFATTNQAQLPVVLEDYALTTLTFGSSTYVYLFGGLVGANDVSSVYKATINSTNGNMGAFSTTNQAQLPQLLEDQQVIVHTADGITNLYIIGGENTGVIKTVVYKATVDSTTGNIGTFSSVNQAQLPAIRARHRAFNATIGTSDYVYVLGGSDGNIVPTVYKAVIN